MKPTHKASLDKSSVLTVKNLTITLNSEKIIDKLSFEVRHGEHITIVGPNGSGKTTLFKALIGTVPYQGTIAWSPDVRIGYVPQKLDLERNVPLSLKDFLESKATNVKSRALADAVAFVHLPQALLTKPLGALSGGEFQRALVAFALIGDTNVLLFDEPTAGIDKPSEEQIYETLHRLQDEHGVTVITISHDLSLVHRYANRVLCLNRRGICFGAPEEVLTPETLEQLYGPDRYKFYHHVHEQH